MLEKICQLVLYCDCVGNTLIKLTQLKEAYILSQHNVSNNFKFCKGKNINCQLAMYCIMIV